MLIGEGMAGKTSLIRWLLISRGNSFHLTTVRKWPNHRRTAVHVG